MGTYEKLALLTAAARYDASCSTSGSARTNSLPTNGRMGMGNGAPGGICHSWSADGRCVALLKVLLSNACAWDCAYCANRRSADIPRAGFEPRELVRLVMDYYRRNYIEGVLLSSAVLGCPDRTMERLIAVAKTLRKVEGFNGYIHLKAIPGCTEKLVLEAASLVDRMSVNIELPSAASLARVAPDKSPASIFGPMRSLARATGFEPRRLVGASPAPAHSGASAAATQPTILRAGSGGSLAGPDVGTARRSRRRDPGANRLPAGQTTQLVVGASPESDAEILVLAENLYLAYDVRRVYYSAFVPISPDPRLPAIGAPPLLREHRLYQADWLFRFYGFTAAEIFQGGRPNLEEDLDPKCAWALRNLDRFPLDINRASYEELLRVPGLGPQSAARILRSRRGGRLRVDSLGPLGVVMRRARYFLEDGLGGHGGTAGATAFLGDSWRLRHALLDPLPARVANLASGQLEFDFGAAS